MNHDEAKEFVLNALADLPSGPPGEEVLAVLLAAAWDEGYAHGYKHGQADCMKLYEGISEQGAPYGND